MARRSLEALGRLDPIIITPAPSREHRRRPRRPQLDDLNSPSEIRLWLPDIQKEMAFCLRRAKDPCQPDHRAAKYERKAQKLRDYYRLCCGRLREIDVPYYEDIQSSPSATESISVTYQVDDGSGSLDSSSENSRLRRVLAPLADLRPDDRLDTNSSYSSGSSFEDVPGEYIRRETDVVIESDSRPSRYSSRSDD